MRLLLHLPTPPGSSALAACLLVMLLAAGFARSAGSRDAVPSGDSPRLGDVLSRTLRTRGIDATVSQYRRLREQRFTGVQEDESETNGLGEKLLRQGHVENAVRVFQLNAQTHPDSADAHHSLGEALAAAGDTALAIASYRTAVALDPRHRGARSALRRLNGGASAYRPALR